MQQDSLCNHLDLALPPVLHGAFFFSILVHLIAMNCPNLGGSCLGECSEAGHPAVVQVLELNIGENWSDDDAICFSF